MTPINLPYLMRQRNRRGWSWYVRRGGRKIRVRGEPGTAEFLENYRRALEARPVKFHRAGTWRWLCEAYFASPEFGGGLATATRNQRRNVLTATCLEPIAPGDDRLIGDVALEQFTARAVRVLRDRKKDHPEAANHRLKAISAVFRWAIEAGHVESNPTRDVQPLRARNRDGHHTWTRAEVEQYRRRHKVGSKARLALEILLYTGARKSDAVRLGPAMVVDGTLRWKVAKTGQTIELPILPQLMAALAATTTGLNAWLVTQYGRPFTAAGFGNWFRDRCNEAGLPHCTAHGLRKAGATIAAENGATLHQLMAIFGWQSAKQALVYTRRADGRRLAQDAINLLVGKKGS